MDPQDEQRRTLILAAVASIAPALAASDADAQDATKVAPFAYKTALENDALRVVEFRSRPGAGMCGVGKHSHPAHLTVALTDAKVRVTLADGRTIVAESKAGDVFWEEAGTHTTENVGGAARALIVEIKPPKRA